MIPSSSPELVFAFDEDGTLSVFDSASGAISEYEGIEVENGVVKFYDSCGIYLQPVFTTPNTSGKLLGLVPWVASGEYALTPNSGTGGDSFALALSNTVSLNPNSWFATLAQLKAELSEKGVVVEPGASGL